MIIKANAKKTILCSILIIAIVMLTSCGISDKEFRLVVGEY